MARRLSSSVARATVALASSVKSDRHLKGLRHANAERWVLRRDKNVSCLIAHRPVQRPARSAAQASAARADLRLRRAAETNDAASSKGVNWVTKVEGF